MSFDWSEQAQATLRQMWDDGFSASAIGKALGASRSAIIGKAHRLRLKARAARKNPREIEARAKARKATVSDRIQQQAAAVSAGAVAELERSPSTLKAPPLAKVARIPTGPQQFSRKIVGTVDHPVYRLDVDDCRWPIGRPGAVSFRFCGEQRHGAGPYCPDHARLAYTPRSGTPIADGPAV